MEPINYLNLAALLFLVVERLFDMLSRIRHSNCCGGSVDFATPPSVRASEGDHLV